MLKGLKSQLSRDVEEVAVQDYSIHDDEFVLVNMEELQGGRPVLLVLWKPFLNQVMSRLHSREAFVPAWSSSHDITGTGDRLEPESTMISASATSRESLHLFISCISSSMERILESCLPTLDSADLRLDLGRLGWT